MSSRTRFRGLVVLVLALLVTGTVLWVGQSEAQFGWFAYAPLDPGSASALAVVSERRQAGLIVSLTGLLLLSGLVGFMLGRRSGLRSPR
ncbi:hypothetical protein [Pedococcus aerophilus]|uniref:hypothetical protein n=1 Tax=Pedococcus aerophilus TaxID=436356 RepID=UPI0031D514CA